MEWTSLIALFALGFSSLLPLVNPVGTALIINPFFSQCTITERKKYAFTISMAAFGIGFCAVFLGSWVLKAMGVSISTTQMAGGFVIAHLGLSMLGKQSGPEDKTAPPENLEMAIFYPMAFPLTVGPGAISTLITLSAHAHTDEISETLIRMAVIGLSLLAVMVITYICFAYSQMVFKRIGKSGSEIFNRLMAFLVFCIGIQMAVTGALRAFNLK
jgi:multiple antibiotic resistance protein